MRAFYLLPMALHKDADVNENVYLFCPSTAQLPVSDITQRKVFLPKKTQGYDKFTLGVSWVSRYVKKVFYAGQ